MPGSQRPPYATEQDNTIGQIDDSDVELDFEKELEDVKASSMRNYQTARQSHNLRAFGVPKHYPGTEVASMSVGGSIAPEEYDEEFNGKKQNWASKVLL
jgi:hypothetical protein